MVIAEFLESDIQKMPELDNPDYSGVYRHNATFLHIENVKLVFSYKSISKYEVFTLLYFEILKLTEFK